MAPSENNFKKIKKEMIAQYNQWAPCYDDTLNDWRYTAPQKLARRLRSYLRRGDKIIDIACGTGLNSFCYDTSKFIFFGVDISLKMIRFAKKTEKYQHLTVGDMQKIPFQDSRFNVAIATGVFEHYPDITPFLSEMRRIVKPRGIIAFAAPCTKQISGFRHSKKTVIACLKKLALEPKKLFKFLSYYARGSQKPIYYWGVIAVNSHQ